MGVVRVNPSGSFGNLKYRLQRCQYSFCWHLKVKMLFTYFSFLRKEKKVKGKSEGKERRSHTRKILRFDKIKISLRVRAPCLTH